MSNQNTASMPIAPSRVSLEVFNGVTWTFYALAVCMAIARTAFRFHTSRRFEIDDGFLVFAILTMTASMALAHFVLPLEYLQNYAALGEIQPDTNFAMEMFKAKNLENASTITVSVSIYSVKFCYMFFFKKLVARVRKVRIWWWFVFAVLVPLSVIGILFDFTICPIYNMDFLEQCPLPVLTRREGIWLDVTTVVDIITDVLLISIPVTLIWNVKIPLRAKLGLGLALCLSASMVVVALLRVSLGFLYPGIADTPWVYFCFLIEASVAVFMVSTTAFRSTFGQKQNTTRKQSSKGSFGGPGRKRNRFSGAMAMTEMDHPTRNTSAERGLVTGERHELGTVHGSVDRAAALGVYAPHAASIRGVLEPRGSDISDDGRAAEIKREWNMV